MTRRGQLRLYFHGVIFLIVAMLIGGPGLIVAMNNGWLDQVRQFLRQSHLILMLTGIWMIASAAALPLLDLTSRALSILVWSLIVSGYTFLVSVVLFGLVFGLLSGSPAPYPTQWSQLTAAPYHLRFFYMLFLSANGVASLVAALVFVRGARSALKQALVDAVR
jgi:hypothetical protein